MYAVSRQIKDNQKLKNQLVQTEDYIERMYLLERYLLKKHKRTLWKNWLVDKTYYRQDHNTAPRCRRMEVMNLTSLLDCMQLLIRRYTPHTPEEEEYITRLCAAITDGQRDPATLERLRFAIAYYFAEIDAYNEHLGINHICERSRQQLHHLFEQVCELLGITYEQLNSLTLNFRHVFETLERQGELEAQISTLVIAYFTHFYLEAGSRGAEIMNKHLTNAYKYFRFGEAEKEEFNATIEELEHAMFIETLRLVQMTT